MPSLTATSWTKRIDPLTAGLSFRVKRLTRATSSCKSRAGSNQTRPGVRKAARGCSDVGRQRIARRHVAAGV